MSWQIETMAFGAPHYLRRSFGNAFLSWVREDDRDVALKYGSRADAQRAIDRLRLRGRDPAVERAEIVEWQQDTEAAA